MQSIKIYLQIFTNFKLCSITEQMPALVFVYSIVPKSGPQTHQNLPRSTYFLISAFMYAAQGCQMVHFQTKNSNLGKFWSVLQCIKGVGKVYGHSEYLTLISYFLWWFGILCGYFGTLFPFWYVVQRKIWQPWCSNIFQKFPEGKI
jgi:hypothetical protein